MQRAGTVVYRVSKERQVELAVFPSAGILVLERGSRG